jgi:hypothetical protein
VGASALHATDEDISVVLADAPSLRRSSRDWTEGAQNGLANFVTRIASEARGEIADFVYVLSIFE